MSSPSDCDKWNFDLFWGDFGAQLKFQVVFELDKVVMDGEAFEEGGLAGGVLSEVQSQAEVHLVFFIH